MTAIDGFNTPGELIESLLESRGWSQRALAVILEIGEGTITRLLKGRQPVTAQFALVLEDVFGVPAASFLALQSAFDLAEARKTVRPDPGRRVRARLHGDVPVGEMMKRGWIPAMDVRDARKVEAALTRFFGAGRIEDLPIVRTAAQRTADASPAQAAWLRRVEQIASGMPAAPYSRQAMPAVIAQLRPLLETLDAIAAVPSVLAANGIRFVVVESLGAAKIDGASLWLNDRAPVIGLSLRIDRIDNFWFVLRHQIEHIARQHGGAAVLADAAFEGGCIQSADDAANAAAGEAARAFGIPPALLDDFIAQNLPFIAEPDLIAFARAHRIHPGIVAGRIQSRTGSYGGRYNRFRAHLAKVRTTICAAAIADGWGFAAPAETRQRVAAAPAPAREAALLY